MPVTNTLENTNKPENPGAPGPLACGIAEIVEAAVRAGNQDLKAFFREERERQIGGLRVELKTGIAPLRTEWAQTRADLQREMRRRFCGFSPWQRRLPPSPSPSSG